MFVVRYCQFDVHTEDLSIQSQLRLLCCLVQSCEGGAILKIDKDGEINHIIMRSRIESRRLMQSVSISIVPQVPPNTTSPPPPEIEEDTGLSLPAIIALAASQD